ncbi:MAG: HD-GYP domain-containing protein [Trueperaceae bacterium]
MLSRQLQERELHADGSRSHLLDDTRHKRLGFALVAVPTLGFALLGQWPLAHDFAIHGMYIPIVIAAYFFGLRGAIAVAVMAALAHSPLTTFVSLGSADGSADWLIRLVFYLGVAAVAGRLLGLVDERRKSLIRTQITALKSFAVVVETEDEPDGEHCERVAANARILGEGMGLKRPELEELYWAGLLHDIGKITVPREILRKPGGLTLEEYLVMRRHARLGANLLSSINSFKRVAEGVGAHHERWDGSGYPGGLQGERIPLFGRILAIVDVFEALSSDRPYRKALARQDALEELRNGAGSQFDPRLVELYEQLFAQGRIKVASQPEAAAEQPRLPLHVTGQSVGGAN